MEFWIRIIQVFHLPFPTGEAMHLVKIQIGHSLLYQKFRQFYKAMFGKP